jgi:hypothetical protein
LIVRRATETDRETVLAFATRTWDDWDYIPHAWPVWLTATDGAFLVACVGEPGGVDAEGSPLEIGQVVAITRVAMVSPSEAWLEGIRVDPRVRGKGVAGDLQIAELHWVAAQKARVLRYATGANNEASHRLGARDDINLIARFHSWWWNPSGVEPDDHDSPSAFDADVREAATATRVESLARLQAAGMIVSADHHDVAAMWRRLDADASFRAGLHLYEPRAWAMNELTEELLHQHVARGEVVIDRAVQGDHGAGWALGIIVREQLPSEDADLRFALLAGDAHAAVQLADRVRRVIDRQIRLRVEAASPLDAATDEWRAVDFMTPEWEMHILARSMDPEMPIPPLDPTRLILAERPDRIEPPRW